MDIKKIKYGGGREAGKRRAGGVIRSEKEENHKNSTHTKIKFYIIFFSFFIYDGYSKFYKLGGGQGGQAWGW